MSVVGTDVVFRGGPVEGKFARLAGEPYEVIVWTHRQTHHWAVEEPGVQYDSRDLWHPPSRYRRTDEIVAKTLGLRRVYEAVTTWGLPK